MTFEKAKKCKQRKTGKSFMKMLKAKALHDRADFLLRRRISAVSYASLLTINSPTTTIACVHMRMGKKNLTLYERSKASEA
jgi:hypothetical protein